MKMNARTLVSAILKQENLRYIDVIPELEKLTGKKYTRFTLSQRLGRGSFSYNEMVALLEILGYEIKIEKTKNA